ncbi:hypothetical protein L3Q82_002724 [Scortum barcoo]|uniref:Uncharacterized protein n=1 Tax=Scortum barcoo TaxID=214431 RepID=A0ACB8VU15_9TELE|nr:hypothetical protein L3Q82_002724 [Scortum barcoo]
MGTGSSLPPPVLTVFPPSSAELQSNKASLVCLSSQSVPFADVSWLSGGSPVSSGISTSTAVQQADRTFQISSYLAIQTSDWNMDKVYTCVSGVTVLTQKPPVVTVRKGETATMDCNLGTVTDSAARWYKQIPGGIQNSTLKRKNTNPEIVEQTDCGSVVCLAAGCTERDKNRLNKLVKRARSVMDCPVDSVEDVGTEDEILRPLVRPYAGAVGPGFLLMQDNARPHVAGVCQQFLQDKGIDAMDWPARSPDLNPIEHIWDIMSRSIHQRHVAPQTVQELADALVQVWEEIPQETIRHLIRSMPRPELEQPVREGTPLSVYCVMERVLIIVHDG